MEELKLKQKELYQGLGGLNNNIKNLKEHIETLKQMKKDYLWWEEQLNSYIETRKKIQNQIYTLEEAEKILLGI